MNSAFATSLSHSLGRTVAIALNLFKETLREQVLYLSLLYLGILVSALVALPQFSFDSADKMTLDVGMAGIEVIALITAVFVAAGLINKEIDKRTIFVLIAKPLRRAELVLGKHLGISLVIAVLVTVMTLIFLGLLKIRNIEVPALEVSIASLFIFLQIMLVSAIAILFGAFTSSLIASLLTLASYLVGNFSRDLLQLGEISKSEAVQAVTRTLYLILPDLSRANLKNEAVYGILPTAGELLSNAVYIISYALLVLALAILIFGKRQL
jgi:ABC-type transport system involved in multi-copper enzyme maturation permease subunit